MAGLPTRVLQARVDHAEARARLVKRGKKATYRDALKVQQTLRAYRTEWGKMPGLRVIEGGRADTNQES